MALETWIHELKCDICDNHLSYFPICLTKYRNICGRCPCEDSAIRNVVYETAVTFYYFPCRYNYKGCLETLLPNDVPKHEENCAFQLEACPLLHCDWKGFYTDLVSHCEERHSKSILKENQEFDLDLTVSSKISDYLVYDKKLLIVSWEFDNKRKKLGCRLHHREELEEKKYYVCHLSLKYAESSISAKLDTENTRIISYVGLLDEHLEVSKITGSLSFEKTPEEMAEAFRARDRQKMLSLLKCNECSAYVLPPIHTTLTDSTVYCKHCCNKTKSGALSNVTLNNLANWITYPCKNKESGCKFTAVPSLMESHQEGCQFNVVRCIFGTRLEDNCLWEDQLHKRELHVDENHPYDFTNTVYSCKVSNELTLSQKVIKFEHCFFKLFYFSGSKHFYCSVMKTEGTPGKFKYEIEFMDINENRNRLIIRKSCLDSKFVLDCIKIKEDVNTCCVPKSQIATFTQKICENFCWKFKICIFYDFPSN